MRLRTLVSESAQRFATPLQQAAQQLLDDAARAVLTGDVGLYDDCLERAERLISAQRELVCLPDQPPRPPAQGIGATSIDSGEAFGAVEKA